MAAITVAPLADVDPAVLARRRALGHDRFDEVWDGVLHMVPPPSAEHVEIGVALIVALAPLVGAAGLVLAYEHGLVAPGEPGWNDYRIPDLMVFRPEVATERAVVGPPELVVEIRSPGDDSLRKLGFYERVGAREVLVVDRSSRARRRWRHDGRRLRELGPDPDGRHRLACVDLALWSDGGVLHLAGAAGSSSV